MLILGKYKREHDERLLAVLVRLLEYRITLNRGKCIFGKFLWAVRVWKRDQTNDQR